MNILKNWSRSEFLTLGGIAVAILALIASLTIPEIRQFFGLKESNNSTSTGGNATGGSATAVGSTATATGGTATTSGNATGGNATGGNASANSNFSTSTTQQNLSTPNISSTQSSPAIAGEPYKNAPVKPKALLSTQCTTKTGTGASVYIHDKDVSINRQLFTSPFSMGSVFGSWKSPALLTCQINSQDSVNKFSNLLLEFGREDNDEKGYLSGHGQTIINLYLDGEKVNSKFISSGEKGKFNYNIAKVSSLAIEVVCKNKSTGCEPIYFTRAEVK